MTPYPATDPATLWAIYGPTILTALAVAVAAVGFFWFVNDAANRVAAKRRRTTEPPAEQPAPTSLNR